VTEALHASDAERFHFESQNAMPRYRVKKFAIKDRDVWRIEDTRDGRLVSVHLTESAALSLAHTLNVADLNASVVGFDSEP
jgi:hypothetical protein